MYQFVVEENNNLKKDLYRVGRTVEIDYPSQKLGSAERKNNQARLDSSTVALSSHVPKPGKKKKTGTNTSVDQSKLHNESVRPKTGTTKRENTLGNRK